MICITVIQLRRNDSCSKRHIVFGSISPESAFSLISANLALTSAMSSPFSWSSIGTEGITSHLCSHTTFSASFKMFRISDGEYSRLIVSTSWCQSLQRSSKSEWPFPYLIETEDFCLSRNGISGNSPSFRHCSNLVSRANYVSNYLRWKQFATVL